MRLLPAVVALLLAIPATAAADSPWQAGARTLGDPLLPQIGNGGYDALHYDIDLAIDRPANAFTSATTTMTAMATENLDELSLDFQDLAVVSVQVNGKQVKFEQVASTPELPGDVTQPMKLVVQPRPKLRAGKTFTVSVDYSGAQPHVFTDPDESIEGWIPACYTPAGGTRTCDSFFVVGEPMGSQAWFPSNNHPSDKATFDTTLTVQTGDTALGVGELDGDPTENGDGTTTWRWSEDDPTATYLVTASNGAFDYSESSMTETLTGRTLPLYNAIDPSATTAQRASIDTALARTGPIMNFYADRYGPYPFDSNGAVAERSTGIGYALEVQGKSHYAGNNNGPGVSQGTLAHEIAHQWFGNSATLEDWNDIWFNEGWAQWSATAWSFAVGNSTTSTEKFFADNYASGPAAKWAIAPAVLDGDPANLFLTFPTYTRGAMTLEGYRQIVGDERFFAFARTLQSRFAHGNVSTPEFIAVAKERSGLQGAELALLDTYFRQWLYGTTKPTVVPADFA
jgi:aminopeptidase N